MPHAVRMFLHAEPTCSPDVGYVRVFELQLPTQSQQHWYAWRLELGSDELQLSAVNHESHGRSWPAAMPLPDAWAEVVLEFDFVNDPPVGSVFVNGEMVVQSGPDAPELDNGAATETTAPKLALGPDSYELRFTQGCTVRYDEVWVAPQ